MGKELLQGNEAIALGAVKAGLSFYAGYPITPASEVLHYLVKTEVRVVQMEDEVASINAIIGASLAGAKAMTATSGPGFSLMQEGIGLAHMIEAPLVVVDVQRVGPSTGMPTLPAQGDILQCRSGSHGDYFPIVFYPNSVSELYRYTIEAFNAAEESLSPVILLSDGYISHLSETTAIEEVALKQRALEPLGALGTRHFTGLTHRGAFPRATDSEAHREHLMKLQEKQLRVAKDYNFYEYREKKGADTLVISFGVMSRLAYIFKDQTSLFRPIRIYPLIEELVEIAERYENILVLEMSMGQYASEVERLLRRRVKIVPVLGGKINLNQIAKEVQWAIETM